MYQIKMPMFRIPTANYGISYKVLKFNRERYEWYDMTLAQFASFYGVSRQQAYRLWDKGVFDQCKSECTDFYGGSQRGINIQKALIVLTQGGH